MIYNKKYHIMVLLKYLLMIILNFLSNNIDKHSIKKLIKKNMLKNHRELESHYLLLILMLIRGIMVELIIWVMPIISIM